MKYTCSTCNYSKAIKPPIKGLEEFMLCLYELPFWVDDMVELNEVKGDYSGCLCWTDKAVKQKTALVTLVREERVVKNSVADIKIGVKH
jgi:hypothetical protein